MNQSRAINTLAFAVVMLAIAFAQIKPETKARFAALYQAQVSRAATVLALTTGHWSNAAFENDAMNRNLPAAQLAMAQMQTVRAHLLIERNQAKLACAQHVLQAKMESLRNAQRIHSSAHVRMMAASEVSSDSSDSSSEESQVDWQ